jgi:hypothetical protein
MLRSANAYLSYRHLCKKLYDFLEKCGEIRERFFDFRFGISDFGLPRFQISDFGFIKGLFSDVYRERKVEGGR